MYHPGEVTFFWIACILLATGLAAEGTVSFLFIRGLRRHRRVRAHFGNPTLFTESDLISAYPTISRLFRRDYRSVADPAGQAFCRAYRLPMLLSYGYAWISAIAAFVLLTLQGPVYLGDLLR